MPRPPAPARRAALAAALLAPALPAGAGRSQRPIRPIIPFGGGRPADIVSPRIGGSLSPPPERTAA